MNWDTIKRMRNYKNKNVDITHNKYLFSGRTFLTDRLSTKECESCHYTNGKLEIHHMKTVRNRNWNSILNKETMVLCHKCHQAKTRQQIKSFN